MSSRKDKKYFLEKLNEFFDPDRLNRVYPRQAYYVFTEVGAFYATLAGKEKRAFESAVLEWLDAESTQENALRIVFKIKLHRALDRILEIAKEYAPRRDSSNRWRNEKASMRVVYCIAALGAIGDPKALNFLEQEAGHSGDLYPLAGQGFVAILAIAFINMDRAFDYLPIVVRGDLQFGKEREEIIPGYKRERYGYTYDMIRGLAYFFGSQSKTMVDSRRKNLTSEEEQYVKEAWNYFVGGNQEKRSHQASV